MGGREDLKKSLQDGRHPSQPEDYTLLLTGRKLFWSTRGTLLSVGRNPFWLKRVYTLIYQKEILLVNESYTLLNQKETSLVYSSVTLIKQKGFFQLTRGTLLSTRRDSFWSNLRQYSLKVGRKPSWP
jgi:hypothetical protein